MRSVRFKLRPLMAEKHSHQFPKKSIRPLAHRPYHASPMNADDPSSIRPEGQEHGADPVRAAPLALWRVARAFLHTLQALFGAPEAIAAQSVYVGRTHARVASWLRCAEAMMRRLLLIEAAAYPKPDARPLPRPKRKRARKLMTFTPEQPEKWRVSFRCFAGNAPATTRRTRRAANPARVAPTNFRSAWPLAERLEALIRVFNDPTAYARRVARRLHAAPYRLHEALREPPQARVRIDQFAAMGACAEGVWRPHRSSA